jgi:hypothetical protein
LINFINRYTNQLFRLLLLIIIIFISSDIFLTIELSGATIRLSYILFSVIFVLWITYLAANREIRIPVDRSYIPLLLFCFISVLSSLNSEFPLKSLIYSLWTIFSAVTIVFLVWFARKSVTRNLEWLLKIYFYSYFVIAILGLYQILLPFIIGEKTPLVEQWWQRYTLARINVFSYEPSFFATYMLMGCTMWFIMWIRNNDFVKYRGIIVTIIGLIIFLSSSRVGWIGIIVIVIYGLIEFAGNYLIRRRFARQNAKFFIYFICGALFCAAAIIYMVNNPDQFDFLFQGTGLFDTSDSSFSLRFERSIQTFKVFIDRPSNIIFGAGPGGVGAYMVSHPEKFQIITSSFKQLWGTEPNTVFIEILASVGIAGFLVFAWFLANIFRRLWDLYTSNALIKKYRIICLALFWGLAMELFILQFNQNYLRPYLWLHIGISIAVINTFEYLLRKKDLAIEDEYTA